MRQLLTCSYHVRMHVRRPRVTEATTGPARHTYTPPLHTYILLTALFLRT